MKPRANATKLIASPQQATLRLVEAPAASGEPGPAAAEFDFAPGDGAEPSPAGVCSTATIEQAPDGSSVREASAPGFTASEASATLRRWTPILLKFASVQMVVQALGFAGGILIVRSLPKQEYALYTLGNMMLAMILVLADSGIGSSMTAIGGRLWQDNNKLGILVKTAMQLRHQMALGIIVIVLPALTWLLVRNGASPLTTATIVLAVLAGCGLELVTRVYAIVLRLKSEFRQIQKQALVGAIVKLAALALALSLYFNAATAMLSVAAAYAVQFWMLRRWAHGALNMDASPDPGIRSEMLPVIRRQSFHALHHCLESQITIWLISIFGSTENVANVGALGRLALLFSIFATIITEIVAPAFARIQSPAQVSRRYWQLVICYGFFCACIVAVIAAFPRQTIWVLGSQYADLQKYGVLIALSMVTAAMGDLLLGLNAARAWIVPPLTYYPFSLAILALLVWRLNLATIRGVLWLGILSDVPIVSTLIFYAVIRMRRMQAQPA